jgi:membrane associated rhomboid family serine protease
MSSPAGGGFPGRTEVAPTCYRHPDRETYIACQRCGRPICPDCMRPASVGFQCPQCVAEGNATVRQPRTTLGGRLRGSGTPVTYVLIALCVLVFLGEQVDGNLQYRFDMLGYAFTPVGLGGVAAGQPYRLLTAIFLHESIVHIGLNMLSLYFVGRPVEAAQGRSRYLAVFFVGGLAGSAAAYLASPRQLSLGASGAIFAVFGTLIVVARKVGADLRGMIGILAINLFFSFADKGISWQAHIGGLVAGLLMGIAFVAAPRRHRTLVQVAGIVVVLAIVIVIVVARTANLGGTLT